MQETHREIDEQETAPAETPERAAHRPEHRPDYGTLHETQHQVDEQATEERQAALNPRRSWTHHGGMVPQQYSAHTWHKQNLEIRMAQNNNSGAEREGQGTEPGPNENDQELQEARAAIEEARRREATERARQQERDRSGPER